MYFAAQVFLRVHLVRGWSWGDFASPLAPRRRILALGPSRLHRERGNHERLRARRVQGAVRQQLNYRR